MLSFLTLSFPRRHRKRKFLSFTMQCVCVYVCIICECFACTYVSVPRVRSAHRGQKKVLDPLERLWASHMGTRKQA